MRKTERPLGIFGIPMDLGQSRRGVDMGPSAIRYARLQDALGELGYRVADLGNASVPLPELSEDGEEARHLESIRTVCTEVCEKAAGIVSGGVIPLFLGGDHSISIGTVSGVARAGRTGVIWIDAHADFNTPETSPSGNIHGMPLAVLAGYGDPRLVEIGGEGASVRPEDVVIVGLRSVDPEEQKLLRTAGVTVFTMKEIDAYGVASVVRRALEKLSSLERVHVSLDLDAVDPEIAPGVGTPVRGGLTYREAHLVMELISESGLLTSLDVVEVNPILDMRNGTAELAVELVASLMGRQIIGLPYSS
ncbi:arginase [Rubrobacter calidifluminis]|uniref:arginase n=1 Tax=Rubrobacter calidifluminis TaxID=1392640 RepID=UPI00235EFE74|nr:arginase [Rubrobacter calidifluminis]